MCQCTEQWGQTGFEIFNKYLANISCGNAQRLRRRDRHRLKYLTTALFGQNRKNQMLALESLIKASNHLLYSMVFAPTSWIHGWLCRRSKGRAWQELCWFSSPTYFFMLVTLIFVMKYIESSRLCLCLVAFFSLKILMRKSALPKMPRKTSWTFTKLRSSGEIVHPDSGMNHCF